MNWKVVFAYGVALILAGVVIGFVESGFELEQSFFAGYAVLLVAYFLIFVTLAYRQAQRPFAHAVLAVAVEVALAAAILGAINYFLRIPPDDTYVFILIEWAITLVALCTGVPAGTALRKHMASRRSLGGS